MGQDGSEKTGDNSQKTKAAQARDARLKAALRANLKRRKAQGRVRDHGAADSNNPDNNNNN